MLHVTLTRILGEPSHRQLKQLEGKLTANLMVVPCPWGHNTGHLGLLQDLVFYLQHKAAFFAIPAAALPAYPVIVAGATTAKRDGQHVSNTPVEEPIGGWNILKSNIQKLSMLK